MHLNKPTQQQYIECFEYALKKYTFRTKVFSTQRVNADSGGRSNSRKISKSTSQIELL